jgi:5-carboxymethyl-2-hydroxymuconate isomerase
MKLGRLDVGERACAVAFVQTDNGMSALRLDAAMRAFAGHTGPAFELRDAAHRGEHGTDMLKEVVRRSLAGGEPSWLLDPAAARWLPPMRFGNGWCAGRNFGKHMRESVAAAQAAAPGRAADFHFDFPTGFMKLPHVLTGHAEEVACPPDVAELDYEVEVAAVIGTPCVDVPLASALKHVFGYTVFNDLSARDWQRQEMRNRLLVMGKNYPGFGPIGPWIVTADEIGDPRDLRVSLSVNGELRQDESCADMVFGFDALIAFWSKSGLNCGDFVASGTPAGTGMHHKPDPSAWYLKAGDLIQADVDRIGTLETRIVVRPIANAVGEEMS